MEVLPAITPAGPAEQLVLRATDLSGTRIVTEMRPAPRPQRRRKRP